MANNHYRNLYSTFISLQHKKGAASGLVLGMNLLKLFDNSDKIDTNVETVRRAQLSQDRNSETGKDRLRQMFKKDDFGDLSPELQMVTQGAMMGLFCGSILGGSIHSRESYLKFMESNQATVFHNHIDAKKRLQDKVFIGFFRGAWMWGWRLGLFTGSLVFITTTISVYRGKSSILEYITAGTLTGMVYKFKSGPKAMIAGGAVGGFLGTIAGSISLALMYVTGTSMEEIRYWQYKWKEDYQQSKLQRLREAREKETDPLLIGHNQVLLKEELQSLGEDIEKRNSQETSPASQETSSASETQ
ncbi:RPII140-upstream gene protein-like [Macrobrachium nipponense]|uniref:RPII140-upstream gene protein-like n=1 Tax=Macrobrachium nipponense TaxID=159736 RepID=UPI0030C82E34